MRNIDQKHIRQELIKLAKQARALRLTELAHFIDVASEVAAETPFVKSRSVKDAGQAQRLSN